MLGNRASLPAALIREERQCHAKAGLTERPLKAGTGDDISWDGNGPPEATPRPHDHREWSRAGFSRTQLLERSPFCGRAHGGAARIRNFCLIIRQAARPTLWPYRTLVR